MVLLFVALLLFAGWLFVVVGYVVVFCVWLLLCWFAEFRCVLF